MTKRTGTILQFTGRKAKAGALRAHHPIGLSRPAPKVGGTVEVYPSDAHGGCWSVFHRSRSGDSLGHVGDFLAFEDAAKAARAEADRLGAEFDGGGSAA